MPKTYLKNWIWLLLPDCKIPNSACSMWQGSHKMAFALWLAHAWKNSSMILQVNGDNLSHNTLPESCFDLSLTASFFAPLPNGKAKRQFWQEANEKNWL